MPRYFVEGNETKIAYFENDNNEVFIWRDKMWRGPYPSSADAFNDQLIPIAHVHTDNLRPLPVRARQVDSV